MPLSERRAESPRVLRQGLGITTEDTAQGVLAHESRSDSTKSSLIPPAASVNEIDCLKLILTAIC
jgi:hypothetical protein